MQVVSSVPFFALLVWFPCTAVDRGAVVVREHTSRSTMVLGHPSGAEGDIDVTKRLESWTRSRLVTGSLCVTYLV